MLTRGRERNMKHFGIALALAWTLAAQGQETFKTRLSPVPIDAQLAPTVTGHGSVSAVLAGTKLNVTGSFEGLRSAATTAHLYLSKMAGGRGVSSTHGITVFQSNARQHFRT